MKKTLLSLFGNSFIRNSFILFSGTMIVNVLNYVFHLVVGRMVEPATYGEIESLVSLLAIISVPAAALTMVATKYAAGMKAEDNRVGGLALQQYLNKKIFLYGTPLLFLMLMCTPLVKNFLNLDSSLPIFFLWSIMALSFLNAITSGILTGWQKFIPLNVAGVSSTILKLVAALLFVWMGFEVSGVVGSYALATLCTYLITFFFLRAFFLSKVESDSRTVEQKMDFSSIKKYILPAFYGMLALAILGNADMIFAKHHLEAISSGEYGALFVVSKTIFFITGVLTTVLFAMSAEESELQKKGSNTFRMATLLTLLAVVSSTIFFFLFPEFILGVFFGEKYLEVSYLLGWFALIAGLYSMANLFLQYLLSLQKTRAASLFLALSGLEIATLFFFGGDLYAIIAITMAVQTLAVLLGLFLILKEKQDVKNDFYHHSSL